MLKNQLITPEGTKDYLFEEAAARRSVENVLRRLFESRGFFEVVTPALEFLDVFSVRGRGIPFEQMQKLVDPKGRLMVLRPDSTLPIARLCATRLKGRELPLRLYYNQPVYTVTRDTSGQSDEVAQAGAELIGDSSLKTDLELVTMALHAMANCGLPNFRLEVGHIEVFNALMDSWCTDEDLREEIRLLIEAKNYPALNDCLDRTAPADVAKVLKQLPRLFGGEEVFTQAERLLGNSRAGEALAYLRTIYQNLQSFGLGEQITVDLGLVNRTDYYTGIIFKGYIEGYGGEVLSGGRYDRLLSQFGEDAGAIGFAVNVDAAARVLLQREQQLLQASDVLVFAASGQEMEGVRHLAALSDTGVHAVLSLDRTEAEAYAHAAAKGILRMDVVEEGGIRTVSVSKEEL